jgi:hypothetical protein
MAYRKTYPITYFKGTDMKCGTKKMAMGGKPKKMSYGGGVELKGKTKGETVKMAGGGSVSKRADGVAQRGKTNCKVV